jgi:transcriptional regulator with XRE-family HTH domain
MNEARLVLSSGAPVGKLLQFWRKARHMSQLSLAIEAGVSSRHLCFIETGRAKPSRAMLLLLSQTLDVPLRERNTLLLAAGLAPEFSESALDAPALEVVRGALDAMLEQQEPYPAVVMNRHWDIVRANRAATNLFGFLLEGQALRDSSNVLRLMFHPDGLKPFVQNWDAVVESLLLRAQREAVGGVKDDALELLLGELLAYPGAPAALGRGAESANLALPIIPVSFRKAERAYDFFSTVTTLGTPQDITAQEIRIECFFPANPRTAERARAELTGGR